MSNQSTKELQITRIFANEANILLDTLAVEEPLEIQLNFLQGETRVQKSISVTMRTPGSDLELAVGFLFGEGIISNKSELKIEHNSYLNDQIIGIVLQDDAKPEMAKLERNFYTTSSCGVCGKASIDAVRVIKQPAVKREEIYVARQLLFLLPKFVRDQQSIFEQTGGLHASALFDLEGKLIYIREDVGRHNALDKLIGACFLDSKLPLSQHILLLSGRASFELIQKAVMAGISIIAAVGAPSSLAVELAKEFNITLIGFLKENKFNVYCGEERIVP